MHTEDAFRTLTALRGAPGLTQRELAGRLGLSLGKVNRLVTSLRTEGLLSADGTVTDAGLESLEPYRVTNAVIMAAGMSTRFAPLSYEKPKALLRVKGELLIEREIRQLQAAGVEEILLVVGYMKEKLFYLADKFGVKIVVNEDYYRYNNPSTLLAVADALDNTYICSSDNYFTENPFEPYVYHAYYAAEFAPGETEEYCMTTNRAGRITGVTHGGRAAWYMIGHAYFDRAFSRAFVRILREEYHTPLTREQLWEDLYIRHIRELDMVMRKYDAGVIREFDSLDELRAFDGDYITNTHSGIFENICKTLGCTHADIGGIRPIKTGLTNLSFFFSCRGADYVYRHPGAGTSAYIDRRGEAASMQVARELGLDDTFIYIDPDEGWKISHFVHDAETLDIHDAGQVHDAMAMIRRLHTSGRATAHAFDPWRDIEKFERALREANRDDFADAGTLRETMARVRALAAGDGVAPCLCHCDCYDPNFLRDRDGKLYLIDWEYSGMADPGCDVGTFLACSDYDVEQARRLIAVYLDRAPRPEELRHFMAYGAVMSYYWFCWALYQESVGKNVGEWLYSWYRHTKLYGREALKLYGEEAP